MGCWGWRACHDTSQTYDLFDELWIQIAPVILGTGKRLFEETEMTLKRFELVAVKPIGQLSELHLSGCLKRRTPQKFKG